MTKEQENMAQVRSKFAEMSMEQWKELMRFANMLLEKADALEEQAKKANQLNLAEIVEICIEKGIPLKKLGLDAFGSSHLQARASSSDVKGNVHFQEFGKTT